MFNPQHAYNFFKKNVWRDVFPSKSLFFYYLGTFNIFSYSYGSKIFFIFLDNIFLYFKTNVLVLTNYMACRVGSKRSWSMTMIRCATKCDATAREVNNSRLIWSSTIKRSRLTLTDHLIVVLFVCLPAWPVLVWFLIQLAIKQTITRWFQVGYLPYLI